MSTRCSPIFCKMKFRASHLSEMLTGYSNNTNNNNNNNNNNSNNNNLFPASVFLQQNVVALIEGSHPTTSACALSTITGIPLIRLHGNNEPFDQCQKAVQMSAGYRDYAHATLDILNTFQWERIALVFDGKTMVLTVHEHVKETS